MQRGGLADAGVVPACEAGDGGLGNGRRRDRRRRAAAACGPSPSSGARSSFPSSDPTPSSVGGSAWRSSRRFLASARRQPRRRSARRARRAARRRSRAAGAPGDLHRRPSALNRAATQRRSDSPSGPADADQGARSTFRVAPPAILIGNGRELGRDEPCLGHRALVEPDQHGVQRVLVEGLAEPSRSRWRRTRDRGTG